MDLFGARERGDAAALAGFSVVAALAFDANLAGQNQLRPFFKTIAMAGGLLQVATFAVGRFGLNRS